MIEARIIADSINPIGNRLTTFVCTYPRFIHAELLTHRDKSRNSASSRAIPVSKMLRMVVSEPAEPVHWGANQKGMQAAGEVSRSRRTLARMVWKASSLVQVGFAWLLSKLGVHKQIANRLIEPFAHMTVVISGTEWGNFFNLRTHKDAQPEFQALALVMLMKYQASEPRRLEPGEWHLPFMDRLCCEGPIETQLKVATARCARVSYLSFDGDHSVTADCQLHDRLLSSGHMSCFEHCARAEDWPMRSGNFVGFMQYRKTIPGECRSEFNPRELLSNKV